MTRRGLTMIEMLLAVALLSAVVAAAASWIAVAGRLGTSAAKPQRQRLSMEAAFALIAEDLVTGDFDPPERPSSEPPRVRVQPGVLEIDTRAGTTCAYRLDHVTHRLERIERSASQRSTGAGASRPLLENVGEFTCALDDEKRTLEVTLAIAGVQDDAPAELMRRRYRLP
jgi:prepilin-type N-terminal cleavage/methylation domain-containing protein